MKNCEVCNKEVPEDFVNLLCIDCYNKQEKAKQVEIPTPPAPKIDSQDGAKNGITDPSYQENPQKEDKEQWMANISQFQHSGELLWHYTRGMYNFIREFCLNKITEHPQYPKFIWKPKIVDVGCGSGVGANVLSNEADFVWGIDKNANSIKFAKEAFERVKNGIYYSSQLTYDNIDIMTDTRDFMKFDIVVAIEIIEHIDDYKGFIRNILKFAKPKGEKTIYFISTPNRANSMIQKTGPKNAYHVREWTSTEFYNVLSEFFTDIEFYGWKGNKLTNDTTDTPILAKCISK